MTPRTWADNVEFQRGYLCALSCIVRGHGTGTEIEEALRALGPVDWDKIEDYDREILSETIAEVERKRWAK